jgi:multiple sugar transport system ATP-binding protein
MFVAGFIGSPSMNFIPAHVVRHGDGFELVLETGLKEPQIIHLGNKKPDLDSWVDREIILGIRPEQITDSLARHENNGHFQFIECIAKVIEPTGPDILVFVDINGREVTCRVHPDAECRPGKRMRMMLDISKALFFDPGNEERIT